LPVCSRNRNIQHFANRHDPWTTELRIKAYQMNWDNDEETVLGEWLVNDSSGTRQLAFKSPQ